MGLTKRKQEHYVNLRSRATYDGRSALSLSLTSLLSLEARWAGVRLVSCYRALLEAGWQGVHCQAVCLLLVLVFSISRFIVCARCENLSKRLLPFPASLALSPPSSSSSPSPSPSSLLPVLFV